MEWNRASYELVSFVGMIVLCFGIGLTAGYTRRPIVFLVFFLGRVERGQSKVAILSLAFSGTFALKCIQRRELPFKLPIMHYIVMFLSGFYY
jgi:hypothetical protein